VLEKKEVKINNFQSKEEAYQVIAEAIEFYKQKFTDGIATK
jgi:inorganic pyrophosphatase